MEIVAGLLRHPSPISIDGSEACETFLYVFKHVRPSFKHWGALWMHTFPDITRLLPK